MAKPDWDVLKDLLGALGALLTALPWYYDFYLRGRRRLAKMVGGLSETAERFRAEIVKAEEDRLLEPRFSSFLSTTTGLTLIFLSFLVSFLSRIGLLGA